MRRAALILVVFASLFLTSGVASARHRARYRPYPRVPHHVHRYHPHYYHPFVVPRHHYYRPYRPYRPYGYYPPGPHFGYYGRGFSLHFGL